MRSIQHILLSAMVIALTTWVVFSPTIKNEFLGYDDPMYVQENPHIRPLNVETVTWVFTHRYFQSYIPLSLLSHSLDDRIWGLDPRGHHLSNNLLHTFNAVWVFLLALMVFCLIRSVRMSPHGGARALLDLVDAPILLGAAFSALLFALHPTRVESVAWVSDRKDLLAGFFLFPSAIAYLRYASLRGGAQAGVWYLLSLFLFVCAVLSKTVTVTAPLVFMLCDIVFFQIEHWRKRIVPVVIRMGPFLLVSLAAGLAAMASVGDPRLAYVLEKLNPLELRLLFLYTFSFYLEKFLWPLSLSPIYTAPTGGQLLIFGVVTIFITGASLLLATRKRPYFLVVWFSYILLLLPTVTGLRAAIQPWADRYSYISSIGIFLLAGGLIGLGWRHLQERRVRIGGHAGLLVSSLGVLAFCAILSLLQIPRWQNSVGLWRYAVQSAPSRGPATLAPMGAALFNAGDVDGAIQYYQDAIAIDPRFTPAYHNLALAYQAKQDTQNAIITYAEAIWRDTLNAGALANLGNIYLERGRRSEAMELYFRALKIDRDYGPAHFNLAVAYEKDRNYGEAIKFYKIAMRLWSANISPSLHLGALYLDLGKPDSAVWAFRHALELDAHNPQVLYNVGKACEMGGELDQAIQFYTKAIESNPGYLDAFINLGNVYAKSNLFDEATQVYQAAIAVNPDSADAYYNLGVLSKARGRSEEAARLFQQAIDRSPAYANAYLNLATIYSDKGDVRKATKAFLLAAKFGSTEARAVLRKRSLESN